MRYNDCMDNLIRKAYAERTRLADLATEFGVTKNSVVGRAFRLGLCKADGAEITMAIPERKAQAREIASRAKKHGAVEASIVSRVRTGESVASISRATGIHRNTISSIVRRLNARKT